MFCSARHVHVCANLRGFEGIGGLLSWIERPARREGGSEGGAIVVSARQQMHTVVWTLYYATWHLGGERPRNQSMPVSWDDICTGEQKKTVDYGWPKHTFLPTFLISALLFFRGSTKPYRRTNKRRRSIAGITCLYFRYLQHSTRAYSLCSEAARPGRGWVHEVFRGACVRSTASGCSSASPASMMDSTKIVPVNFPA